MSLFLCVAVSMQMKDLNFAQRLAVLNSSSRDAAIARHTSFLRQ